MNWADARYILAKAFYRDIDAWRTPSVGDSAPVTLPEQKRWVILPDGLGLRERPSVRGAEASDG